tara:strand:+ start:3834 stop:4178 length:345 start_codon:yes stop_codon:yes gene_type:complete
MAIQPGTYNFTVQRRSDHVIPLLFKDGNNNAIDLTGFTVEAEVWEETRSFKYADFSVTYTDRSAGSISISLTDVQTATFTPSVLKYDVLVIDASGKKEYYLEGTIFVSEGYTST